MPWEHPEKYTYEFLESHEWKEAPVPGYEVCEYGIVRRPLDLVSRGNPRPGTLYGTRLHSKGKGYYVLIPKGNSGSEGIKYKPPELMEAVFGKFRNTNLLNYAYCARMNALISAFNAGMFEDKIRRTHGEQELANMMPMRKCHDCGKKTRNFRCDACWTAIRAKVTSCDHPDDEYGPVRGR